MGIGAGLVENRGGAGGEWENARSQMGGAYAN